MTGTGNSSTIASVIRSEWARVVARLAVGSGDVGLSVHLAEGAVAAAHEHWPATGVPADPGAWLLSASRATAERWRHEGRLHVTPPGIDATTTAGADGDVIALVFATCHPSLPVPARVALLLRVISGLGVAEIAHAYREPAPVVDQRVARALRTLADAKAAVARPEPAERSDRLAAVLEAVHVVFNDGYAAGAVGDPARPDLCVHALALARLLTDCSPYVAEAHGLLALMQLQAARLASRIDAAGRPVRLADQDRARWDRALIAEGLDALDRAIELGGAHGPYALQAAIVGCHVRAARAEDTDWSRIAALYTILSHVMPSPMVQLNRAVAMSMAQGPQPALELVDRLAREPAMVHHHLLPRVRADLLVKLGRAAEARAELERAAALTGVGRGRDLSLAR